MTLGHEAELSLRRCPRVRLVGLETVREKPQGGTGIPGPTGGISMVKQKSVQNQVALSCEITGQNSKPQMVCGNTWSPMLAFLQQKEV